MSRRQNGSPTDGGTRTHIILAVGPPEENLSYGLVGERCEICSIKRAQHIESGVGRRVVVSDGRVIRHRAQRAGLIIGEKNRSLASFLSRVVTRVIAGCVRGWSKSPGR